MNYNNVFSVVTVCNKSMQQKKAWQVGGQTIFSFGPREIIGQAYYRDADITDTEF